MKHPVARRAAIAGPLTFTNGVTAVGGGPPRHAQVLRGARRHGRKVAAGITVAGVLAIAIASSAWLSLARQPASAGSSVGISRPATASGGHVAVARSGTDSKGSPESGSIQLTEPVSSAKPYQAVPIRGSEHGASGSLLQVQRSEGNTWVSFPLPTTTDRSGQFATYVELGKPGRYWLRMLDPRSGATSDPVLLVIKA